ncbi:MAG: hypothetical protein GY941_28420 [Planctomycetes bacterium]|nr:hypothetical protein [Planctomycetota bacterium]
MYKIEKFFAVMLFLSLASGLMSIVVLPMSNSYGKATWLDFAHPDDPHPGTNGPIKTRELFDPDPSETAVRPLLVVLMEFPDITHDPQHTAFFFSNEVIFGTNRASGNPSLAEIFHENSNGRLKLVPALAGDKDGTRDGIVEWVKTDKTLAYWNGNTHGKRAEAIRLADAYFDYSYYDNDGPDGIPDSGDDDGIITAEELLVILIQADPACDSHPGHIRRPGCTGWGTANVRPTDPSSVPVENGQLTVRQQMAAFPEQKGVGIFAHELGHQSLGLGDLYEDKTWCGAWQRNDTGYLCANTGDWYPSPPGHYSFMGSYQSNNLPHLDPWAKIHLGFVKPLVITHDGRYTLFDVETVRNHLSDQTLQPESAIIYDPLRTEPYKEYFILENRNREAINLLNTGLAVWQINENKANNWRRVIRLIRKDGYWAKVNETENGITYKGITWDGDDPKYYDLTATSSPRNTNWTDDSPSYIEVYNISPAGPSMTFDVRMPPLFIDKSHGDGGNGSQEDPFNTIQEGISAIPENPRTIRIAGGAYPGSLVIKEPLTLMGWKNGDVIIGR